jgi:hypothetical protein
MQDEDSELSKSADNQGITANASSSMKPSYGFTYYAENVVDGNLQTWWSPKSSVAFNNSISIDLNKSLNVRGFKILAGSHYPNHTKFGNIYFKNHRVKKLKVEVYQGQLFLEEFIFRLEDEDGFQSLNFPKKIKCSTLIFTPLSVYPSTQWPDICISEIVPKY